MIGKRPATETGRRRRPPTGTEPKKVVTVREVAARAGVSTGTVSHVLNKPEKVAPATLQRVQQAIEQLGWTRNQLAQQLRGGRSCAVAAVVVELSPHTVAILDAIDSELGQTGLTLQVAVSRHRADLELEHIELFERQRARAILLSPVHDYQRHLHRLRELQIPVVLLGRQDAPPDLCTVFGDDRAGGGQAIAHLVEHGHRRIAIVGGTSDNVHVRFLVEGARAALPADAELTRIPTSGYGVEDGIAAARELLTRTPPVRPTAVFAINDRIAAGIQRTMLAMGFQLPDDLSIVGYDDDDFAGTAALPLTTIDNPRRDVGREAVQLLLDELVAADSLSEHVHRQVRLAPRLIIRDSTSANRRSPGR